MGIPEAGEVFQQYSHAMGLGDIPHWQFYMALSFFRLAVNLQVAGKDIGTGVYTQSS